MLVQGVEKAKFALSHSSLTFPFSTYNSCSPPSQLTAITKQFINLIENHQYSTLQISRDVTGEPTKFLVLGRKVLESYPTYEHEGLFQHRHLRLLVGGGVNRELEEVLSMERQVNPRHSR
jgi:hypothetical protein